jgi:hypothetical protein
VNGTLPNGSDLQPLAEPTDLRLDLDQRRALSAFTHAAWGACEARSARYFAFFPLDEAGALWSLSRVSRLGRGARGWVLVAWSALIEREVLGELAWPAHRLLPTAFPEAHVPARGERFAPVKVALAPASDPATDAWRTAIDVVAASLSGAAPCVALRLAGPTPDAPPLTAEGALFALWSRLGRRRAGLSFCTWGGVETAAYPPPDRPFNVVAVDAGIRIQPRPGRREHDLHARAPRRPSLAAEVVSFLNGVDFPPREASADPAADAVEVGAALFAARRTDIARDPAGAFESLTADLEGLDATFAPAREGLFELLALAAAAAAIGAPRARVVAAFEAGAKSLIAETPQGARKVAAAALSAKALAFLSDDQWRRLAPALFGTPDPRGASASPGAIWPSALHALARAPAREVNWETIVEVTPPGQSAAPLLRLAAARAWDRQAGQTAFDRLSALGRDAVVAFVDEPGLAPRARREALARLIRSRKPRPGSLAGSLGHVAYQRHCLWLRDRARAALTSG